MSWLAGQVWPWMLLAILAGFALTWVASVRKVPTVTPSGDDAPTRQHSAATGFVREEGSDAETGVGEHPSHEGRLTFPPGGSRSDQVAPAGEAAPDSGGRTPNPETESRDESPPVTSRPSEQASDERTSDERAGDAFDLSWYSRRRPAATTEPEGEREAAFDLSWYAGHRAAAQPEPQPEPQPERQPEPRPAREPDPEPEAFDLGWHRDESAEDGDDTLGFATVARPYGPGSSFAPFDGSQPPGYPVKGNADTRLYHTRASRFFSRVRADVWFDSEESARAAGFTRWDRRTTTAPVITRIED